MRKYLSLLVIAALFILFVDMMIRAAIVVDTRRIGTDEGIYTNYVSDSPTIKKRAADLTQGCLDDALCKAQRILDYVTAIPYKEHHSRAYKPERTIQQHFGDCDDKSNLLISLLRAAGLESYLVLVPQHIFVITKVEDRRIAHKQGLWLDGKKYYILESTAENSQVGYPLKYSIAQIEMILDPFTNKKVAVSRLEYR
jgi:hypothetical protein